MRIHVSTAGQDTSCKDKDAFSVFTIITIESKESVHAQYRECWISALSLFSPVVQGNDWDLAHIAMAPAFVQ